MKPCVCKFPENFYPQSRKHFCLATLQVMASSVLSIPRLLKQIDKRALAAKIKSQKGRLCEIFTTKYLHASFCNKLVLLGLI